MSGVSADDLLRWCPTGARVRPADLVERLRWATHPRLYAAQLPRDHAPSSVEGALRHYLSHGAERGLRLCALFAPDWYAAALADLRGDNGAEVPSGPTELFFHWLTVGWERRIVPTPLFDGDWFAARHPRLAAKLARSGRWSFEHYLTEGCYQPEWVPSPLGRHHPGGDAARNPATGDPLLLRELLHRAGDFHLARTSWLEEGQRKALARLATLETPRMRELIAQATALDPAVRHTSPTPFTTVPPYRTRRLYLAQQAEVVRREVGLSHADVIVLVAGQADLDAASAAAQAGRAAEGTAVVVTTDVAGAGAGRIDAMGAGGLDNDCRVFDLAARSAGLEARQRLDLLLDLLRGLTPRRVVLLDSRLGREAVLAYGRQLTALCDLVISAGGELLPHAAWIQRGRP